MALAVNPEVEYVKVRMFKTSNGELFFEPNDNLTKEDCREEYVVLAKERIDSFFPILKERGSGFVYAKETQEALKKGKELLRFESPFEIVVLFALILTIAGFFLQAFLLHYTTKILFVKELWMRIGKLLVCHQ